MSSVPFVTKGDLYKPCVRSVKCYSVKCRALKREDIKRLQRTKMRTTRMVYGRTLKLQVEKLRAPKTSKCNRYRRLFTTIPVKEGWAIRTVGCGKPDKNIRVSNRWWKEQRKTTKIMGQTCYGGNLKIKVGTVAEWSKEIATSVGDPDRPGSKQAYSRENAMFECL